MPAPGHAVATDAAPRRAPDDSNSRDTMCAASLPIPMSVTDVGAKLALSAVIEELDGTKSYWALAHPPGKPDFHHPDCFALTLEARGRA